MLTKLNALPVNCPPGTLAWRRPKRRPDTCAVLMPLTACLAVICAISWPITPANSASELK